MINLNAAFDVSSAVILNLFQDNMLTHSVMLKQVQHDEFFVEVAQ